MVLKIPQQIWQQMTYYAEASAPNEVTGIGLLEIEDQSTLLVQEIFLPHQAANAHECQFEEGALNNVIVDVMERGGRNEMLCFRWHSHVGGQVFWSAKDVMDIEAWEGDWLVSLVMNTFQERLARLDLYRPLRVENAPVMVKIEYPENADLRARCAEEVQTRVKELPYAPMSAMPSADILRKMMNGGRH